MADEENLDYLNNLSDEPEPEEEPAADTAPEPEEEPAADTAPEPEEEPAADTAPEPEEESAADTAPKKRSENRFQKLANERNAEREARIRAEAERDAILKVRQAAPIADTGEAVRKRQEKLDLMEPHERAIFLQNEQIERMNNQLLLSELRSEDRADKAAYDAKALVDPRYARNKAAVEEDLKELRNKGINASREDCLIRVIGRKTLAEKPKKSTREAASTRVASTKGTPTTAKGHASTSSSGKGDDLAAIESRLKGKSFSEMFGS